jgi:site-specific DNA recombinase
VRCIVYARYSTDRQTESSIEDQQRVCREFVDARGWTLWHEFADRAISGAALGNRPELQLALSILGVGDALVVNDITRISRSQDLAPLLARLRHRGVRVLGVQDGFDSEAQTARMQAGLSGIMSEEFRANIADRTRSALLQRAREGRATGGKAFDSPDIVREIFARFAAGESLRAIASDLNVRGIPSPGADWKARSRTRGKWMVSAVRELLRNERYIGRVIYNRSRWLKDPDTGIRKRIERPEAEWVVTECERIVDDATWARVQARFRTSQAPGGAPAYLLSGLLRCGACGGKLTIVGGTPNRRYGCAAYHAGGEAACGMSASVVRQVAEEYILRDVQRTLLSPEAEAEGVRQMREARKAAETAPAAPVDTEVATLERLVAEGVLSAEIARPALEAARRKAQALRAAPVEGLPWPTPAAWREAVAGMCELLRGPDVNAAREALRDIVGEIPCKPEGEFLVAEIAAQRVLMSTGTGVGIWSGSGGRI